PSPDRKLLKQNLREVEVDHPGEVYHLEPDLISSLTDLAPGEREVARVVDLDDRPWFFGDPSRYFAVVGDLRVNGTYLIAFHQGKMPRPLLGTGKCVDKLAPRRGSSHCDVERHRNVLPARIRTLKLHGHVGKQARLIVIQSFETGDRARQYALFVV